MTFGFHFFLLERLLCAEFCDHGIKISPWSQNTAHNKRSRKKSENHRSYRCVYISRAVRFFICFMFLFYFNMSVPSSLATAAMTASAAAAVAATATLPHSHADVGGVRIDEVLKRGERLAALLPQAVDPLVQEVGRLLQEEVVDVRVLAHPFAM